ncbi:MAG: intersectin-EH binding protein Ibp1 [Mycobacterium sp.]|nr:intersectin-EH binding protein Ibp1 [Mycobacterium sp.]
MNSAQRLLLAGGFAVAALAAPILISAASTATPPGVFACPSGEVLDTASGACKPLTDQTPTTLNPIEPGAVKLQPNAITSAETGNVGRLPEVDGIPCNGNHGGGGGTGECIGLEQSAPDVNVPHVNTGVTG